MAMYKYLRKIFHLVTKYKYNIQSVGFIECRLQFIKLLDLEGKHQHHIIFCLKNEENGRYIKSILVLFAQTYAFIVMKTRLKFIPILTVQNSWYNVTYLFIIKPRPYDNQKLCCFFSNIKSKEFMVWCVFFLSHLPVWH